MTGEFALGSKLPNENELMDDLNVSRTTIREAVKILISKNILYIERGKGTYVAAIPGLADDPYGFEFIPEEKLIPDLCETRSVIEPQVCYLAAQRATKRQLSEMEAILRKMNEIMYELKMDESDQRMIDQLADCEMEFHSLVYCMTGNIVIERMLPTIKKAIALNYTTNVYLSLIHILPKSLFGKLFESSGTLTIQLYLSMQKAKYDQAFGIAVVLLIIVLGINLLTKYLTRKFDVTRLQ